MPAAACSFSGSCWRSCARAASADAARCGRGRGRARACCRASAGDALLSSLLIGPLAIGVAVRTGGATALAVERCLGLVVRRVMLPVFLGLAALHTDLRELGRRRAAPALALLVTVIAIKLVVAYGAARARACGCRCARDRRAAACGGIMTIAISSEVLDRASSTRACTRDHAGWTGVDDRGRPLLPRTWIGATNGVIWPSIASRRGTNPDPTTRKVGTPQAVARQIVRQRRHIRTVTCPHGRCRRSRAQAAPVGVPRSRRARRADSRHRSRPAQGAARPAARSRAGSTRGSPTAGSRRGRARRCATARRWTRRDRVLDVLAEDRGE